MKNASNLSRTLFLLLSLLWSNCAWTSTLRQYTPKDGLANPVVSCVFQDRNGLLWLGTADGISTFDSMRFGRPQAADGSNPLSGATVYSLFEAEDLVIWGVTDRGLFRFDRRTQTFESFKDFGLDPKVACGQNNEVYVIGQDNTVACYLPGSGEFKKTTVRGLTHAGVMKLFADEKNNLWILGTDGNHRSFSVKFEDGEPVLTANQQFKHNEPLLCVFYQEGSAYFVDATCTFYEYNFQSRTKHYIQDIRSYVQQFGRVSAVIKHGQDFFVGFAEGGLLRIKNIPDAHSKYKVEETTLKTGILSLATDRFQDVVWAGTDGQGVYMHFTEAASLDGVLSTSFPQPVNTPLNAIVTDANRTLWIATDGNGLLAMHNHDGRRADASELLTTDNSLLGSNTVCALTQSCKNRLWIGTENGLNYYSYADKRIKSLQVVADGKPLKYVRALCESDENTLWAATAGEGVVKINLAGTGEEPVVTTAMRITINGGDAAGNLFTAVWSDGGNTIWMGTQTNGLYRLTEGDINPEPVQLSKTPNKKLNTIHTIYKNKAGHWLGTDGGLVHLAEGRTTVLNEMNGLPCNAVFGILEDGSGNLWLSTDRGLVKYNMEQQAPYLCKLTEDKAIIGFAPGAAFKDNSETTLFFAGANGIITVNENEFAYQEHTPPIQFTGFSVFGRQQNIYDYLVGRDRNTLKLRHDQNVFAISFVANDYIDGAGYTYFYRLDGQNNNWVDNGQSTTANFSYLYPGTYTFSAKYRNNVTGKESPAYSLRVRIAPPWYLSWWAYVCYVLLAAAIIYVISLVVRWQNRRKKQAFVKELEERFMHDTDKLKLKFFADVSNELYNPLTMILNSSWKMQSHYEYGTGMHTYSNIIQQNALLLDELLKDITQLSHLENGEYEPQIQTLPVSEMADFMAGNYIDKATAANARFQIKIKGAIYWNTDSYCLRSIINNLLGFTFNHLPADSTASIKLFEEADRLCLQISASTLLVSADTLAAFSETPQTIRILEQLCRRDNPIRDELVLTIAYRMVKLLGGEAEVRAFGEEGLEFSIALPQPEATDDETNPMPTDEKQLITYNHYATPALADDSGDPEQPLILLLGTNHSLLWLLNRQLVSRFRVDACRSGAQLFEQLAAKPYSLIISEAILDVDGIELMRTVKQHADFGSIPCIILASENTTAERKRATDAGVDLYFIKPVSVEVLEKEVEHILHYQELQNRYTSTLQTTFRLGDETFANEGDEEFYTRVLDVIGANLANPDLSVELISETLDCLSQELYARLKHITRYTPNEIIREYRLSTAELMLLSSKLPVDEVIEKTGFVSRSTFYKVFSQKYGMTPRSYREQHKKKILEGMENRK